MLHGRGNGSKQGRGSVNGKMGGRMDGKEWEKDGRQGRGRREEGWNGRMVEGNEGKKKWKARKAGRQGRERREEGWNGRMVEVSNGLYSPR